jgi:hypothetical protein
VFCKCHGSQFTYLEQRKRRQKPNLELLAVCHTVFLRADEVEKYLGKFIKLSEFLKTSIGLRFGLAASGEKTEVLKSQPYSFGSVIINVPAPVALLCSWSLS